MSQVTTNGTELLPASNWPEVTNWNSRFAQLLDSVWHAAAHPEEFVPGVELREQPEQFELELDLPGIDKKDVSIDISGRRVSVTGTRATSEPKGVLRHRTRSSGSFGYEVTLPSRINEKHVTATLADGVLTLVMPKSTDSAAFHVPIH